MSNDIQEEGWEENCQHVPQKSSPQSNLKNNSLMLDITKPHQVHISSTDKILGQLYRS